MNKLSIIKSVWSNLVILDYNTSVDTNKDSKSFNTIVKPYQNKEFYIISKIAWAVNVISYLELYLQSIPLLFSE